jgi:hypothetical protein
MRHARLERYATEAGLAEIEVLSVDNDFFRPHRLHPPL